MMHACSYGTQISTHHGQAMHQPVYDNYWYRYITSTVSESSCAWVGYGCSMVVQLTLLGYILRPIFMIDSPWLVLGYSSFMVVVATLEAISRPQYSYKAGGSRRC